MAESINARTAAEVAEAVGGRLDGPGDVAITGLDTLDDAGPGDVTFIAAQPYVERWPGSKAAAAVVRAGLEPARDGRPIIVVDDAEIAIARLLEVLHRPAEPPAEGVHPSAVVDPTAVVGPGCRIGPLVSVGPRVKLGAGVILHAGCHVYADAELGEATVIHSGTVVRERCRLGARVLLHQNVSIGADGFGYRPKPDGTGLLKMQHLGAVRLGDDVEIGAGTCVDRGKFGDTVIEDDVKLDNLIQIAHNCRIGRSTVIAGRATFAGSVTIGRGVQIGGEVSIKEQVRVGDGARIGARSGVLRDIPAGETWLGAPAVPHREGLRRLAALNTLPDLAQTVARLAREAREVERRVPDGDA